jgi:hypothetical protein
VKVDEVTPAPKETTTVVGKGELKVADQDAGTVVTIEASSFPTENGWVVVRDYMDGTLGNVLGAARFSSEEGLVPTAVNLLRKTEEGSSYRALFYTESGDKEFSLKNDTPIDSGAVTFKAK